MTEEQYLDLKVKHPDWFDYNGYPIYENIPIGLWDQIGYAARNYNYYEVDIKHTTYYKKVGDRSLGLQ